MVPGILPEMAVLLWTSSASDRKMAYCLRRDGGPPRPPSQRWTATPRIHASARERSRSLLGCRSRAPKSAGWVGFQASRRSPKSLDADVTILLLKCEMGHTRLKACSLHWTELMWEFLVASRRNTRRARRTWLQRPTNGDDHAEDSS